MTSKSGGGPPLPSHYAFLPPGVSLSNSPPPVPRPLGPAPLHPQSDQVYPKTSAPEPIRVQICGHLGQYSFEASDPLIVPQLIEAEQRQSTMQFQQQMMFQQLSSQWQQTSQSEMNMMMMMRMMMQRPLTVPMDHVGHTGNSETVVESSEQTSKTIFYVRTGGNLTSEPAHSVPGVGRSAHEPQSSTDRDGATMDHDYHGQSVRSVYYKIQSYPTPPICFRIAGEYTLWKCHTPNFLNCLCAQSLPVSCVVRYIVANIHSPQNSDWSQIYTLMLKRLGTDLQASTDRIKKTLWRMDEW